MITAIETEYQGYRFRSRTEARWAVFFDALGLDWRYEVEGFDLGAAGWYLPDFWLPELQLWCEIKGAEPGDAELRKLQALAEGQGCNVLLLIGEPGPPTDVRNPLYRDLPEIRWGYEGRLFVGDYSPAEQAAEYSGMPRCRIESLAEFLQEKADEGLIAGQVPAFDGTQATLQQLIDLDRQYYRQSYGQEHPIWRWGYMIDELRWCERQPRQWALSCAPTYITAEHSTPALLDAYRAARAARFEHGEQPSTARHTIFDAPVPAQVLPLPASTRHSIFDAPPPAPQPPALADMLVEQLIAELQRRGVQFADHGTKLHIEAPRGVITDELRALLTQRKQPILGYLRWLARPQPSCTIAQLYDRVLLDQPVGVIDGHLLRVEILPAEKQGTRVRGVLRDKTGIASLRVPAAVYAATTGLWQPGKRVLITGRIVPHDGSFAGVTTWSADGQFWRNDATILEVLAAEPWLPATPPIELEVIDGAG